MDVHYEKNGVSFVWNARKAAANAIKYAGITFDQAAEAFFGPFLKLVDAVRNHESLVRLSATMKKAACCLLCILRLKVSLSG